MEVVGHDNKKVLWEVVDDHFAEDPSDHEEIGLWGVDFNVFDKDEEGADRERSSKFPYLLIVIKLCPGYCISKLKSMNRNVDEENGKALNKGNVRYRKVCRFSSNEF